MPAVVKYFVDGTVQNEFSIGIGTNEVKVRSNGGILEFQNNGGGWFTPASSTWQEDYFTVSALNVTNGYLDLSATPITRSEFVFIRGIKQGHGAQYTISGNRITFLFTLTLADEVEVRYQT